MNNYEIWLKITACKDVVKTSWLLKGWVEELNRAMDNKSTKWQDGKLESRTQTMGGSRNEANKPGPLPLLTKLQKVQRAKIFFWLPP